MAPITTTLNDVKYKSRLPKKYFKELLNSLGKTKPDNDTIAISYIAKTIGLEEAIRCCYHLNDHSRKWRLFSVSCVRRIEPLLGYKLSSDVIDVAERYANGNATNEELNKAWETIWREIVSNTNRYSGPLMWLYAVLHTTTTSVVESMLVTSRISADLLASEAVTSVNRKVASKQYEIAHEKEVAAQLQKFTEIVGE